MLPKSLQDIVSKAVGGFKGTQEKLTSELKQKAVGLKEIKPQPIIEAARGGAKLGVQLQETPSRIIGSVVQKLFPEKKEFFAITPEGERLPAPPLAGEIVFDKLRDFFERTPLSKIPGLSTAVPGIVGLGLEAFIPGIGPEKKLTEKILKLDAETALQKAKTELTPALKKAEQEALDLVKERSVLQKTYKEVGIESEILLPRRVFQAAKAEDIGEPLLQGVEDTARNINTKLLQVKALQKEVGVSRFNPKLNREISEKIFNALDNPENIKIPYTQAEQKVVVEIKNLLSTYADRLDNLRFSQGLPPINRRQNYITNLIQEDIKQAIRDKKPVDSQLFGILDQVTPKQVFSPFLKERKGELPIQRDVWKALQAYISVTEKKLTFDPLLEKLKPQIEALPPNAQKYARWFVGDILGRKGQLDSLLDASVNNFLKLFGSRKLKVSVDIADGIKEITLDVPNFYVNRFATTSVNKVKMANYINFIGMNLRTMIINFTQMTGAMANLPGSVVDSIVASSKGLLKVATNLFSPKGWQQMKDAGILNDMERLMDTEFAVGTGVLADITMWNMKVSEFINRVFTAESGKVAFKRVLEREGVNITDEEALALGKELSDLINFKYGLGYTPKLFRNPVGNLYFQYQSFAFKQLDLLMQMAKNIPKKDLVKDFVAAAEKGQAVEFIRLQGSPTRTALVRYVLYATAVSVAYQQLFGFKMWESFARGAIPSDMDKKLPKLMKGIVTGNFSDISAKDFLPPAFSRGIKGMVPVPRTQIKRFREAENLNQLLGFEQLPYTKKKSKQGGVSSLK